MDLKNEAQTFASSRNKARPALHPVHEAAMRLAASRKSAKLPRTRDLVSMLLSHGARAWRGSQPKACIHLHISGRSGNKPVRLYLE